MTKWTKEQESAIFKDSTNIIVSAGAGSGKTAVLTERVLNKVKNGISLSNLLILTFTNLAAKEMKERIGDKLKKEGLLDELSKLDSADITTFDAYSLGLVKKYYYVLNISKDINIIDSSVIYLYKKKTLKNIFEDLYNNEDKEFLNLISEYSLKDDKELFDYILNVNDKLDLKIDKVNYINTYLNKYYDEEYIDKMILEYDNSLFKIIDNIRLYLEYIDDSEYLDKLYSSLNDLLASDGYDDIISNLNINLPKAIKVSDTTKLYKSKISDSIKELKKLCIYSSTLQIKEGILKTKPFVKTILDIINILDKKVFEYKNKYNYYEYADIARMAIKLVRDYSYIREEIKNNLNEILIDEYQDTNDIQEEFISYIANNNVYMVGDIKQSIYRFRNANPYIFKNKYDAYSINNNGIKIDLNKNFRSREEVINNINLIFDRIMDDEIGGANYQKEHQMIFGNLAYNEDGNNNQNNNFEIYNYLNDTNYKKEEVEAFIIANDINDKINNGYLVYDKDLKVNRKIKYSDFVILMDKSKNFELYKKILEYNKINTTIMKSDSLLDGEVIILIKNIISFIIKIHNNSFDNEFKRLFLSIGRSFIFEIDDNILFNYFVNNNFKDSDIYKISKTIADEIDSISIENIIDIIVDRYDLYNRLILIGDYNTNIIRIEKLKDITKNIVNLDYNIYDYQEYLEDIANEDLRIEYNINDSDNNSVKIMTIHASKGLEFSVVYYSSLYNKFNIKEATSKFTYDNKYGIVIPYKNNFIYNTIYHNLSYLNYVKENISERIRIFYVALTRAKEKMIFLLPSNNKELDSLGDVVDISIRNKYNSFASMLYSIEPLINSYKKNIDIDSLKLSKDYNIIGKSNYHESINKVNDKIIINELNVKVDEIETKTFSKDNLHIITKEENSNLSLGKRIHELFELTDFKNPNFNNLTKEEISYLNNFIKQIDINYLNAYKEYEFVYDSESSSYHGIIDLMLEYKEYIDIIDYKLKNITDKAYLKQLNGYKEYIEKTFNKKTNIYLYSIIDNRLQKL